MHFSHRNEKNRGTFKFLSKWSDENFPVYGPNKELVLSMEKVATPLFGIVTYGVQLLAYQSSTLRPKLWIARRSKTKRTFPGMLDSTVGGGIRSDETPIECLIREAEEEASFDAELTKKHSRSVGVVTYANLTDERNGGEIGCLRPEVQFCYDMQVDENITPVPGDGEVEAFELMDVGQLQASLAKEEFAPTNSLVVLDFLIRHGIITFENEPDYLQIASRLHRDLYLPTM